MEVASLSVSFNAGEHKYRVINVTLDRAMEGKSLRLAFITPKGRSFMSGELEVNDLKASFEVPAILLDGRGKLLCQAVIYENGEFAAKSRIEGFYVDGSLDEWSYTDKNGTVSPETFADTLDGLTETAAQLRERINTLEGSCFALETALEDYSLKTDPPALITSLKSKKWLALGDGQTEQNSYKTTPYTETVQAAFGISQVLNYGEDGSTLAMKSADDTDAMCERARSLPADMDLVTVFGGGEDMRADIPLGTLDDGSAQTFYGGADKLCRTLLETYVGKTIVFITPTQQNKDFAVNGEGLSAADYADALKNVCRKYSIPVYDANGEGAICTAVDAHKNLYTADGLYLNDAGHALIANGLFNFIRNLSTVKTVFLEGEAQQTAVSAKSVRLNKSAVSFDTEHSAVVTAVVSPSNAEDKSVTWSSSPDGLTLAANGNVCTVSASGAGEYVLTCTSVDGGHTASCSVTVTEPYVAVQSVTLEWSSAEITVGGDLPQTVTVLPSNATDNTVTWSTDSDCVSITPTRLGCTISGVSEGTATVTCTAADGGISDSCTVTVNPAVVLPTSIRFGNASVSVKQGATKKLTVYFLPTGSTAQDIVFSAENSNVTLDANGTSVTLTGVTVGTCKVTATTADGALTASCSVTVLAN